MVRLRYVRSNYDQALVTYPIGYLQSLELSEIEEIVTKIEQEKEAGESVLHTYVASAHAAMSQRPSGSVQDWPLLQLVKPQWHRGRIPRRSRHRFVFWTLSCISFLE